MMNNYEAMTFPVMRIRLYIDIDFARQLLDQPDLLYVNGNISGGIYKTSDEGDKQRQLIEPIETTEFKGIKAYIKQKNSVTTIMDSYKKGLKTSSDLNEQVKVPIELLCYDDAVVSAMKKPVPSIYNDILLSDVISYLFGLNHINDVYIDPIQNNTKFGTVLLPNLELNQSLAFLDQFYGLYEKGGMLFCDIDKTYLVNSDVNSGVQHVVPLYVHSINKADDGTSGMIKIGDHFHLMTPSLQVSMTSETSLQKTIQSSNMRFVHSNDLNEFIEEDLNKEFGYKPGDYITKVVVHDTENKFLASNNKARIDERSNVVSVSGTGFDINKFKIISRFNLVMDDALRGRNNNRLYRPVFVNHVMTNLDSNLFMLETTMQLTSN
jgi:hypothetical protein